MDALELLRLNLLSPMVLAFVLGLVAVWVKSDLKLPEQLYTVLSIYLLFAIGLKGGGELSVTSFAVFWKPLLATLVLGVSIPLVAYQILLRLGRLSVVDAAAIAAHYGSVSAVTFTAALSFAQAQNIELEGFMPALLAALEVPGIVVALLLARASLNPNSGQSASSSMSEVWRELFTGRSLFVLLGGLVIGWLSGKAGLEQVKPFFVDPFKGALTLFLLEMGMVAASRLRDFLKVGGFLTAFAIVMPVINGTLGVVLGHFAGLSVGGSFVLGAMAGSASYIAAPAAIRVALPQANPAYYLGMSLGVTFPFNLSLGIPLYYAVANALGARA
jgi:uncharacterized protein